MKTFLEHVAEDMMAKYGTDMSATAVIFPNKRASLFLNELLARKAGRPIWSPAYITISDLFRQQSPLVVADNIKLVCDLYRSFSKFVGEGESLDRFYGWGELLLSDFDDIDKHLADAQKVFANLRDIHEYDDVSYLNERQKAILKKFFSNFSDDQDSKLKQRFLELWSRFGDIYTDYKQRLRQQGLAYEGMLYRDVAEAGPDDFPYDRYVFVGFSLLQNAEKQLFERIARQGKASFYWDFDHYYMPAKGRNAENEAGHFVTQYLEWFPNELQSHDKDVYDQLRRKKTLAFGMAPTEDVQARYVSHWLGREDRLTGGKRTAIVLCNEHLLPTVVHCLPAATGKVNVTTGYPLQDAPITSFVNHLFSYFIYGGKHHYKHLARHPYARLADLPALLSSAGHDDRGLTGHLARLATAIKTIAQAQEDGADPFVQESLFRMYALVNRLDNLVQNGDLAVDAITLQKLLLQLIQGTSIPFHGEPAEGIQVMGVLETRCLDFDHLLILSCNEGNMPKGVADSSFIPYAIRKAYGLTTAEHKTAVYAYYFHRMIQRAEDVTILYNHSTEDGHTGEMSRFMLQLMVEGDMHIEHFTIQAGQEQTQLSPKAVEKSAETVRRLDEMARKGLYPTSVNRYMRCPLQFFFCDITGIAEPDSEDEDEIDSRMFGNIFHRAAQLIYGTLTQQSPVVMPADIEQAAKHPETIERAVDQALLEEMNRGKTRAADAPLQLNGLQLINREVIIRYLRQLLKTDKLHAPFYILGLEKFVETTLTVTTSRGDMAVRMGGIIDRLDLITDPRTREDRIRVVDYKTGARALSSAPTDVADVFVRPVVPKKHADYYLQTMLYATMVRRSPVYNEDGLAVSPALLFIQHATAKDYDPTLWMGKEKMTDIENWADDFMEGLKQVLAEMLSPEIPFTPTADRAICGTCPYRLLCGL